MAVSEHADSKDMEPSRVASPSTNARSDYEAREAELLEALTALESKNRRLVWLRTTVFIVGCLCLIFGYFGQVWDPWLTRLGLVALVAFFVLIVRHEAVRLQMEDKRSFQQLLHRMLARLDRNWAGLEDSGSVEWPKHLPLIHDLDVANASGLFRWLNLAMSAPGRERLRDWILSPPGWQVVLARQTAVRALVPQRDLRIRLHKSLKRTEGQSYSSVDFLQWATSPNWYQVHPIARWTAWCGPIAILLGAVCAVVALASTPQSSTHFASRWSALGLIALGFAINMIATFLWGTLLHTIFLKAASNSRSAQEAADTFTLLSELPEDGGLLSEIRHSITGGESSAQRAFQQLKRPLWMAAMQRNPLLYIVYLFLQLTLLWDFRVLELLENWKSRFATHVRGWYESLATYEALSCAAAVADENPTWSFPVPIEGQLEARATISDQSVVYLTCTQLGHPLLRDGERVVNDLTMPTNLPLLLVTGSNMAGKSTFLRSIGLNLLIARTGSPVCASHFATPMFELATSIRVQDSLSDGVSFFMAELRRLKEVVDTAQRATADDVPPLFFLLDEILQGTNSQERQIAVATVVDRLLALGAIGIITTHDLDLASAELIASRAQTVHFREYFETIEGREVMKFDYRMRPGPTPTTNALKLLQLVGLGAAQ